MTLVITEPGLYEIPELEYHADPVPGGSFSSTQAKQILKSPAHLRSYLDAPRVEKKEFDFGHIVHGGVLGVGLEVEVLPFPDYKTKAAQVAKAEAYAAGKVPMIERDYAPARAAIAAVLEHEIAGPLFAGEGVPESSAFGIDPVTGLWLRGRFDWTTPGRVLVDLKTTRDGSPRAFSRAAGDLGYDVQDAFYRHVYELATGEPAAGFVFVTVESAAPHLVDVHQGDDDWRALGAAKMRRAIDRYKKALDTGEWPGRPPIINELTPTPWAMTAEDYEDE